MTAHTAARGRRLGVLIGDVLLVGTTTAAVLKMLGACDWSWGAVMLPFFAVVFVSSLIVRFAEFVRP